MKNVSKLGKKKLEIQKSVSLTGKYPGNGKGTFSSSSGSRKCFKGVFNLPDSQEIVEILSSCILNRK
ncbi:hypothetical protein Y1Q_0006521 [Alligator mississippiensis]|nr:hypothetical protein Y1Q_0006521 [Alligator mississippiensis]